MTAKTTLGIALLMALADCTSGAPRSGIGAAAARAPDTARAEQASPAGGRDSAAITQELVRLEEEWKQAFERHDTAILERIVADDYLAFGPEPLTKRDLMKEAKDPSMLKVEDWSTDDMRVRVLGGSADVAVVTGHNTQKGRDHRGKRYSMEARFSEVWVQRDGRWQCIAGHYSHIMLPKRQD